MPWLIFFSYAEFLEKIPFQTNLSGMTSVTKCLDPDTGLTNCFQRLSPSDKSQLAGTFMYEPLFC